MWTGLGAGILRQCSYTTVRLGVYRKLEEKYYPKTFGEKLALGKKNLQIRVGYLTWKSLEP